ncbi:MAG: hypothetical protein GX434_08465 [Peptococcaceae bacterium]|nr:hypothetical protein [Peptococcaceae bacterium]
MLKNIKYLCRSLVIMFSVFLLVAGVYLFNNNHDSKSGVIINTSYAAEAKDPIWGYNNSDLVIIGEIIGKDKPQKGKDNVYGEEVVYEDTNVKISKIVKNLLNEDLKEGSKISIRTIGGEVNNFKVEADTMGLLPASGNVLVCLVDGKKLPGLPLASFP